MSATARLVVVASLTAAGLAATTAPAWAQEGPPGACACAVPAAPAVVAAPPALPRWGVGLRLTSLGLAPEDRPEEETRYGGGGLQLRYRVAPRWQLELAVDHVREQLDRGEPGERHLQAATLAALFHPRPHARWDWYLLAGVGATGDGDPEATDAEREASAAAHVHLGVGVERRVGRIGVAAELRAVGVAPVEQGQGGAAPAPAPARDASMTVPTEEIEVAGNAGGQLSIAATYYF